MAEINNLLLLNYFHMWNVMNRIWRRHVIVIASCS